MRLIQEIGNRSRLMTDFVQFSSATANASLDTGYKTDSALNFDVS